MRSQLATGTVLHHRFSEPEHRFRYGIHMLMLNLDELSEIAPLWRRPLFWWRRQDYLGEGDLKQAVLARMNQLSDTPLDGTVWLLGQYRNLGLYFSPVNFYLLEGEGGFTHMLAEVSNTPWNERHHYLVPLSTCDGHDKAFHVSPFMPMGLQYQWQVTLEQRRIGVVIRCLSAETGRPRFVADLRLTTEPLNQAGLWRVWRRTPSMTIKTVAGIYFEALRLWLKGATFYPHPQANRTQGERK
ncbi:DUF1365 domain-containing protein [Ferrimonas balearica]|uniref:DUF1365 domain-containing protein n=1 Tax=Ferrimonas balearica TaxID=44012 RepID=UPI001C98E7AF|nr:DUF1365 domain-containing protein [Ferrimonas balearica]MBY5921772.1 DUF1365 domain-containing protein [Ferrimonas balearica]MBY5994888.1 DUF1365 domain-containing protein [Ferrimonas balearica]